jgi:hypothetical protein
MQTHFQNLPATFDLASSNVDTSLETVVEGAGCGRKLLKECSTECRAIFLNKRLAAQKEISQNLCLSQLQANCNNIQGD